MHKDNDKVTLNGTEMNQIVSIVGLTDLDGAKHLQQLFSEKLAYKKIVELQKNLKTCETQRNHYRELCTKYAKDLVTMEAKVKDILEAVEAKGVKEYESNTFNT